VNEGVSAGLSNDPPRFSKGRVDSTRRSVAAHLLPRRPNRDLRDHNLHGRIV
jgi:class 3 adenylate cyclase